jgi:hypothetical protein
MNRFENNNNSNKSIMIKRLNPNMILEINDIALLKPELKYSTGSINPYHSIFSHSTQICDNHKHNKICCGIIDKKLDFHHHNHHDAIECKIPEPIIHDHEDDSIECELKEAIIHDHEEDDEIIVLDEIYPEKSVISVSTRENEIYNFRTRFSRANSTNSHSLKLKDFIKYV